MDRPASSGVGQFLWPEIVDGLKLHDAVQKHIISVAFAQQLVLTHTSKMMMRKSVFGSPQMLSSRYKANTSYHTISKEALVDD